MKKIELKDLLIQILKNQQVLLACSQLINMYDVESKQAFYDSAFKQVSDTRFILDSFEKQLKEKRENI